MPTADRAGVGTPEPGVMGITSLRGGVARPQAVDPQYRLGAELPEQRGCGRRFGASSHGIQGGLVTPQRLDLPFTVPASEQLGSGRCASSANAAGMTSARSPGRMALTSVMISPGMNPASLTTCPGHWPGGHRQACQPCARTHADPADLRVLVGHQLTSVSLLDGMICMRQHARRTRSPAMGGWRPALTGRRGRLTEPAAG